MVASVKNKQEKPLNIEGTKLPPKAGGGNYFSSPKTDIQFIPSGCKILDLALGGGGWARRRIANIIGNFSSGKSLLVIEASTNFVLSPNIKRNNLFAFLLLLFLIILPH